MVETRMIVGHAPHTLRGLSWELPWGFAPLKLCDVARGLHLEVNYPVAIVGRHSEADVRLPSPDISRRHCELAYESGEWRVRDLHSLNGIYVNNVLVRECTLYTGDMLRIGPVQLLIEAGTPVRLTRAQEEKHQMLRRIIDVLPVCL